MEQNNNWTNQLLALEVGAEQEFDTKHYDAIMSTKTRLLRNDKGQWQTKKQIGSKTFTVRRTR